MATIAGSADAAQTADTQAGAHLKTAQEKAEEFIARIREKDDVTITSGAVPGDQAHPRFAIVLDAETVKYMVDHKMLFELKEGQLSNSYADDAEMNDVRRNNYTIGKDKHFGVPVYVIPGVGMDKASSQVLAFKDDKGGVHEYILAAEGAHNYDAAYYRQYLQPSDADIKNIKESITIDEYVPKTPEEKTRYNVLLGNARLAAKQDGVAMPEIVVNPAAGASDAYALQTKEGHEIILVSRQAMDKAMSSDNDMVTLKDEIASEMDRIKTGKTTPEGIIREQKLNQEAGEFFREFTTVNGKPLLPWKTEDVPVVSNAALKHMTESGDLIEVRKKDLLPSAASNPVFNTKDKDGHDLPIYVAAGIGADATDRPRATIGKTKEGKEYILINEGYHQWTVDYAKTLQRTDAGVNNSVQNGFLQKPEDFAADINQHVAPGQLEAHRRRYQELMQSIAEQAKEMNVMDPMVLVDTSVESRTASGTASASTSVEGTNYITLDKTAIAKALSSDAGLEEMKGVIGHELSHVKNGDTLPEGIVRMRNLANAREYEMTRDLEGAGPLGSRKPAGMIPYFEKEIRKDVPEYNKDHPNAKLSADKLTDQDMKAIGDWQEKKYPDHPSDYVRIMALKEEQALMIDYEKTHQVTTHEDRVRESAYVVSKVLQDMHDNKMLSPDTAHPDKQTSQPDGGKLFNGSHEAEISKIGKMLAQVFQKPVDLARAPENRPEQSTGRQMS